MVEDDVTRDPIPRINKSKPLDFDSQISEIILEIIREVVDKYDLSAHSEILDLRAIEHETELVVQTNEKIDDLDFEQLLTIRNEIARHPAYDLKLEDTSTSRIIMVNRAKEALIRYCKGQALHEARRKQFRDVSEDTLAERVYLLDTEERPDED